MAEGDRLPHVVEVPPGYGKTAAVVLAWLWRRRGHPDAAVRAASSRRLVYALPQRALADQVAKNIATWLDRLGLVDEVGLHVIMGGRGPAAKPWREQPERDSILVGTIDMITSKALMRAYGTPRHAYPIDAALLWNDAHLVVDEVQGAPATTITLRQVDAFRLGRAAGATGLTLMSATVPRELVETVDHPYPDESDVVRLSADDDDTVDLSRRRSARKLLRRVEVEEWNAKAVAAHVLDRHRPNELSLVIVNTVKAARELHSALRREGSDAELLLLHSQFRPCDRVPTMRTLDEDPPDAGRIVVSTQVVEAGIDIDAAVLTTMVAPWHSLIQRAGRCNRTGRTTDAELWWIAMATSPPYVDVEIAATDEALRRLEGQSVTNEELLAIDIPRPVFRTLTIRRPDFLGLFDTAPDVSGHDLDIAPYVRDVEELSVQVCWMTWQSPPDSFNGRPTDDLKLLDHDYRCRVPVGGVAELIKAGKTVWRFDPVDGRWRSLGSQRRARPGDVVVVAAQQGGYSVDVGFSPTSEATVGRPSGECDDGALAGVNEDGSDADPNSFIGEWVPLDTHLEEAAVQAGRLADALGLRSTVGDDLVLAARLHDVGKAHPTWQDALCRTAADDRADEIASGRPWAKSAATRTRLKYAGGVRSFRHELASVELLDGPLAPLIEPANDADLVRYLVLTHHGKLRVQVRDPNPRVRVEHAGERPSASLFGLCAGDDVEWPIVLGVAGASCSVDLSRFGVGVGPPNGAGPMRDAWADVVERLIERYGVFRLAYFEMVVRVADWRASALHDRAGTST